MAFSVLINGCSLSEYDDKTAYRITAGVLAIADSKGVTYYAPGTWIQLQTNGYHPQGAVDNPKDPGQWIDVEGL